MIKEGKTKKETSNSTQSQNQNQFFYLLSQYKFTMKFVLGCTVRKRINNRLIFNMATKAKSTQTHTAYYYHSTDK